MKFSWDNNKSAKNKVKHGIDFEQAKEVFEDDNAIVKKRKNGEGRKEIDDYWQNIETIHYHGSVHIRKTTIRIISLGNLEMKK